MASATKEPKAKETTDIQRNDAANNDSAAMAPYRRGTVTPYGDWGGGPFDRVVEQIFRGWPAALWPTPDRDWRWGLDVRENDGEVVVRAEAPGFDPGDFDVQVRGDQLVLCACHKAEGEEKERGYREWSRQEFYRSVPLPASTDPNKVEARYRNGILTVTLPKAENGKERRIPVQG